MDGFEVDPEETRAQMRAWGRGFMEQRIVGFHQDEEGHWVAELECGHGQHVRHVPPWQVRPWVTTPEGRASVLGTTLRCPRCAEELTPGSSPPLHAANGCRR
jgi:hypothetical protein